MANDSLSSAALAFDANSSGSSASVGDREGGIDESSNMDTLFGNVGVLDGDSPEAGGDGLDDEPAKKRAPAAKKPAAVIDDEDDEDDPDMQGVDDPDGEGDEGDENGEEGDPDEKDDKDEDESDVYEVMVDGERQEVSLKEALSGYIRTETFHRRLNYLNEVKDTLRTEAVKVVEQRNEYQRRLEAAGKLLDTLAPQEPNWAEEYRRNPDGADELRKNYESFQKQRQAILSEIDRVKSEDSTENEQAMKEYVARENQKILANNPHWAKDPERMKRDVQEIADTCARAGFSEEEILSMKDSRMLTIAKKAMLFDRLQKNKPKPIRRGQKPVKPGAGRTGTVPKAVNQASKRLNKTGSLDSAAALFTQLIKE